MTSAIEFNSYVGPGQVVWPMVFERAWDNLVNTIEGVKLIISNINSRDFLEMVPFVADIGPHDLKAVDLTRRIFFDEQAELTLKDIIATKEDDHNYILILNCPSKLYHDPREFASFLANIVHSYLQTKKCLCLYIIETQPSTMTMSILDYYTNIQSFYDR